MMLIYSAVGQCSAIDVGIYVYRLATQIKSFTNMSIHYSLLSYYDILDNDLIGPTSQYALLLDEWRQKANFTISGI